MKQLFGESLAEPLKICCRCKNTKPLSDFSPHKERKDGVASSCKKCHSEMAKALANRRKAAYTGRPESGSFRCCLCKETKDVAAFSSDCRTKRGLQSWCKECSNKRHKEWREHKRAEGSLAEFDHKGSVKRKVSLEEYERLLTLQNGVCAICKQKPFVKPRLGYPTNTSKPLFIDHCHKTGAIRGLLCIHCNNGLGNFKDSIERLQSAIAYLTPYACNPMKGLICEVPSAAVMTWLKIG